MKYLIIALSILFMGDFFSDARANSRRQNKRIKHGLKNGEISKAEGMKLRQNRRQLRRVKKRAARDGEISDEEKMLIRKKSKRNSRAIYRAKHNDKKQETTTEFETE